MARIVHGVVVVGSLAALFSLTGCGGDKFTYVPVSGKVTMKNNKKTVSVGVVVFVPDKENTLKKTATGKIGEDGTYDLNTEGRSGVPIGSYIICVRGPMGRVKGKDPPPIPYSNRYFDANESPLRIEVVANPAPGAYDIELSP